MSASGNGVITLVNDQQSHGAAVNWSLLKINTIAQAGVAALITASVLLSTAVGIYIVTQVSRLDPPHPMNDHYEVFKNSRNNFYVLSNDFRDQREREESNITISAIVKDPGRGTVRIANDRTGQQFVIYNVGVVSAGNDSFEYKVENQLGLESEVSATVHVHILNRVPQTVPQYYVIEKNSKENKAELFKFVDEKTGRRILDIDGDELFICNVTKPVNGVAHFDSQHVYYTPDFQFNGIDTMNYTVCDGDDSVTDVITFQVRNSAPIARPDFFRLPKHRIHHLDVLANDYDPNNDPLTITWIGNVGRGGARLRDNKIEYLPFRTLKDASDPFEYRVSDGFLESSSYGVINVYNRAPAVLNAFFTVPKNSKDYPLSMLEKYTDPDPLDTVTLDIVTNGVTDRASFGKVTQKRGDLMAGAWEVYEFHEYTLQFTPVKDDIYLEEIQFVGTDGDLSSPRGTITINVTNTAPVAIADDAQCGKNLQVSIKVVANDYDPNGDQIVVVFSSNSTNGGTTTFNATHVVYTAPQGFLGNDTFSYRIKDVQRDPKYDLTAEGVVNVHVVNYPPVGVDDVVTLKKGLTQHINVLQNDYDPNHDKLFIHSIQRSSAAITPTISTINGVHHANYSARNTLYSDTFTYFVMDEHNARDMATVTVTVVNTPPVANPNTATVHWRSSIEINVMENDFDENPGDVDLLEIVRTNGAKGTVTIINNRRALRYNPPNKNIDQDTFTYVIRDQHDESNPATVTVTVTNNAPVANPIVYSQHHGTNAVYQVTSNDFDPDSDPFELIAIKSVSTGSATLSSQGGNTVIAFSAPNIVGNVTIEYIITDFNLNGTGTATIQVTNRPPVANPNSASIHWNSTSSATINVLSNDMDPDGDTISITGYNQATGFNGNLVRNGNQFTYYPSRSWRGQDQFTYSITDNVDTASATVTFTVTNNARPSVQNVNLNVHWRSQKNSPTTIPVINSLTDNDGDVLTLSSTQPDNLPGSLTIINGKSLRFTQVDWVGTINFQYTLTDGLDTSQASASIEIFNNDPVAATIQTSVNINQLFSGILVDVLDEATDEDSADVPFLSLVSVGTSENAENLQIEGSKIRYIPKEGYNGTDEFTYTISDGLKEVSGLVRVTVPHVAPSVSTKTFFIHWSTQNTGSLLDLGITEEVTAISTTIHGNSSYNNTLNRLYYQQNAGFLGEEEIEVTFRNLFSTVNKINVKITVYNNLPRIPTTSFTFKWSEWVQGRELNLLDGVTDSDDDNVTLSSFNSGQKGNTSLTGTPGVITYIPNIPFVGSDSFLFSVTDGIQTVQQTCSIVSTNTKPTTSDRSKTVHWRTQNSTGTIINILDSLVDADGDNLTLSLTSQPSNGNAQVTGGGKSIQFTSYNWAGQANFGYKVSDGIEESESTIQITVTNAVPIPQVIQTSVPTSSILSGITIDVIPSVIENDIQDVNHRELVSVGSSNNSMISIVDGKIEYVPVEGFHGYDTFTYTVTDGLAEAESIVNVSVPQINVANLNRNYDIKWSTQNNGGSLLDLTTGGVLQQILVHPANGNASLEDGKLRYIQDTNFLGSNTVEIRFSTSTSTQNKVTVTLNVYNNLPSVSAKSYTEHWTVWKASKLLPVMSDAFDADGDTVSLADSTQGAKGSTSLSGNQVNYTSNAPFVGNDQFHFTVSDGIQNRTRSVQITSTNLNTPSAENLSRNVHWRTQTTSGTTLTILNSLTDSDGDTLTLSVDSPPAGTVQITGDGKVIEYVHQNFVGQETFQYTISDGVSSASANITINTYNNVPVPENINASISPNQVNTGITIDILNRVTELDTADIPHLQILFPGHSPNAEVSIENGRIKYVPNQGYHGLDTINYTVTDGISTAQAYIYITVPEIIPSDDVLYFDIHWRQSPVEWNVTNQTVVSVTAPSHGQSATVPPYAVRYTANENYLGSDTFTANYDDGITDQNVITIHVNVFNNPPVAQSKEYSEKWDKWRDGMSLDVKEGSSDDDNDPIELQSCTNGTKGYCVVEGEQVRYKAYVAFVGTDTFTYTITDGIEHATRSVNIISLNPDVPTTSNINRNVHWRPHNQSNTIVDIITSTTQADGDELELTVTNPSVGSIAVVNDGKSIQFSNPNWVGTISVDFTVSDGIQSSTSTLTITVFNSDPNTPDIQASVPSNTFLSGIEINVLQSVTDDDNLDVPFLKVISISNSENAESISLVNGVVTYIPKEGYSGTDILTYNATDGLAVKSGQITISVPSITPVELNRNYEIHWKTQVNGSTFDLATGGTLSNIVKQPTNGIALIADNKLNYTQEHNFLGTDTIDVRFTTGRSTQNLVKVTIQVYNRLPVIPLKTYSFKWSEIDTGVQLDLMNGVTDADNDVVTLQSVTNGQKGNNTQSGNDVTYKSNVPFVGQDSFQMTVTDGIQTRSRTVTISSTNTKPSTTDMTVNNHWRAHNTSGSSITILSSLTDSDGDNLTLSHSNPNVGSVVLSEDKKGLLFSSNNFVGTEVIQYTVTDGVESSQSTVTFNIFNSVPIPENISVSIQPNQMISGIIIAAVERTIDNNAADVPHLKVTYLSSSDNAQTVETTNNGKDIRYIAKEGFSGVDTIMYGVSDGISTGYGFLYITVPVIVPTVLLKQYDIHWSKQNTGSVFDLETSGTLLSVTNPSHGTANISDNKLFYQQNTGYLGSDYVEVTFRDLRTSSNRVQVNLNIYNTRPTVPTKNYEDNWLVWKNGKSIHLLANVTDADGDTVTLQSFDQTTSKATITAGGTPGWVTYQTNGFNGQDSFTYVVFDGIQTRTGTVNIKSLNNPPSTSNKNFEMHWREHRDGKNLPVTNGDSVDPGETLTLTELGPVSPSSAGSATISGLMAHVKSLEESTFVNQQLTFTYTVSDGLDTSTSNINVMVKNAVPVANPDTATVHWTGSTTIAVLNNDSDDDAADVPHLEIVDAQSQTGASLVISADRKTISYTPSSSFSGSEDTFVYRIFDGIQTSSSAQVTVTLSNDPPITTPFSKTIQWNMTSAHAPANCTDPNGDTLTISIHSSPSHGTWSPQTGIYTPSSSITYEFTPDPEDQKHKVTDSFSYSCSDGKAVTTGQISVTIINTRPVANPDTYSFPRDASKTYVRVLNVLANDFDADGDPLTIDTITVPQNHGQTVTISADRKTILYEALASFEGTDTIYYKNTDDNLVSEQTSVTIAVENHPPHCEDINLGSKYKNETWPKVYLVQSGNCVDPNGDSMIGSIPQTAIEKGTIEVGQDTLENGQQIAWARFVGNPTRSGPVSFDYVVSDGSLTVTRKINLEILNQAPVIPSEKKYEVGLWISPRNHTFPVTEGTFDPDVGDSISLVSFTDTENCLNNPAVGGRLYVQGNNILYEPKLEWFNITCSFLYTITDNDQDNPLTATGSVAAVVVVNHPPHAVRDIFEIEQGQSLTITFAQLLANDTDPNGGELEIVGVECPSGACRTVPQINLEAKTITIQADPETCLTDRFVYRVRGTFGLTSTANVYLIYTKCFCFGKMDFLFVVDGTNSNNFQQFKPFMREVGDKVTNKGEHFVGVVQLGYTASIIWENQQRCSGWPAQTGCRNFGKAGYILRDANRGDAVTRINQLNPLTEGTNLVDGIRLAINHFKSTDARGRTVPKVILTIVGTVPNIPCSRVHCEAVYGPGKVDMCDSSHYPNKTCDDCQLNINNGQYCSPCADARDLAREVNSWRTALNGTEHPMGSWKMVTLPVGNFPQYTLDQLKEMNYDPRKAIHAQYSELNGLVWKIVDQLCDYNHLLIEEMV